LRHVAIRSCTREKFAIAPLNENVQHSLFECWIGGVTVYFPAVIAHIKLDAAANRIAAIDSNRSVAKIGPSFAIPGAKLDDVDLVT